MGLPELSLGLTIITLIGTTWNAWTNRGARLMLAEFQLNLRKEMNGRYISINSWDDLKSRVQRLEHQHDEERSG